MHPWHDCEHSENIRPITINVGGAVGDGDLIGREDELDLIQQGLTESKGVVLVGDRRVGKTNLMSKVSKDLRAAGHDVISFSAETTELDVFVTRLEGELGNLSWFKREQKNWAISFAATKAGVTVTRTPPKGKERPATGELFDWIAKESAPSKVFVLIDELAVFLQGLAGSDNDASEFMHSLRHARETNSNLHMVFAGSIGLHHVVPPASGTRNELKPILIGSITTCDGMYLAQCLARGKDLELDAEVAWDTSVTADGIPYYIQYIIQQLSLDNAAPGLGDAARVLDQAFNDSLDPLDANHYRDRLAPYYGDNAGLAERMLNEFATSGELSIDQLQNQLSSQSGKAADRKAILDLLGNLERDNYLSRTPTGANTFSSQVLTRMWCIIQRLNS